MAEVDQVEYAESTESIGGGRPWAFLLDSEGLLPEEQ